MIEGFHYLLVAQIIAELNSNRHTHHRKHTYAGTSHWRFVKKFLYFGIYTDIHAYIQYIRV